MTLRPWLAATVVAAMAVGTVAVPVSAFANPSGGTTFAGDASGTTGRYLVRYAPGADVAAQARSLRAQGIAVRRSFGHAVKAAAVSASPAQAAALARSPRVASVEVDALVRVSGTQSDAPWGLDRLDQRVLPLSTTFTAPSTGAGVDVYVVDTGVLAGHADFGGRVAAGWTAIDDGRGSSDCNGHGTHVAGTVAGTTYGVAKAARIIPVRVLDCNGSGYMSAVVAALDWVAARHVTGTPAVVNLSLGGGVSSTVDAAVNGVVADGVTVVAAAGNSAVDACTTSPAGVEAALTVAASNSTDQQASFSNHGPCVDLYAPGVSILSAWHTSSTATAWLQGTSMAAPHVAGAAAVLLSQDPTRTPAEISATLAADATLDVVKNASSGTVNRLLHLEQAAEVLPREPAVTAPGKATSLRASARKRSARVSWVRGRDGGSPLTRQTVVVFKGKQKVRTVRVSGTATALTVLRLKPRAPYAFRVIATNRVGNGPASALSNRVRPRR